MGTVSMMSLDRHRMGTDGNGVTTLILLSGCPLHCKYCINADVMSLYKPRDVDIDTLINSILCDYCYFKATGGGIAIGGGEPLLQIQAVKEIVKKLKFIDSFLDVTIETCLNVNLSLQDLEYLVSNNVHFMVDTKSLNPDVYKRYTDKLIDVFLANLKVLVNLNAQGNCRVRVPIIKGYTSDDGIDYSVGELRKMGFTDIEVFEYKLVEV